MATARVNPRGTEFGLQARWHTNSNVRSTPRSARSAYAFMKSAGVPDQLAKNYFFALLVADFCCCFCLFVFWVFFGLLSPTCCLLLFAIRLDYRPVRRPLSRDATKVSPR